MPATKKKTDTRRVSAASTPKAQSRRTKLEKLSVHARMLKRVERERTGLIPTAKLDLDEPRLNIEQFCDRFHLNHWTVREWLRIGKVKYLRLGRRIWIPESECERVRFEGIACD